MEKLNLFHKGGLAFLFLSLLVFGVYFVIALSSSSVSSEGGGRSKWKTGFKRLFLFCVFLGILSMAGLMPRSLEEIASQIWESSINAIRPLARQIPGLGKYF